MPIELNERIKLYVDKHHKKMCENLATYYLSHGLMCRLHVILEGKSLRYVEISHDALTPVSEIDGSIVPYSLGYKPRFHLARYKNEGLGIVDSETNRFYHWNTDNDENLKWAQEFADLMEKDNLDSFNQSFIFIMHALMPVLEWSSEISHRLFKSFSKIRKST